MDRGGGEAPPAPALLRRARQGGDGANERGRMPGRRGLAHSAARQLLAGAENEQARAGLGQKVRCVDGQRAHHIAQRRQRAGEIGEVRAAIGGQGANHVFDDEKPGRAALGAQPLDDALEAPEGAGARALQARAMARQRQVLTGKGGPGEIGSARQGRHVEPMDVAHMHGALAPVGAIAGGFAGVEIIGEETAPALSQPRAGHAAACEEFIEGGLDRLRRHGANLDRSRGPVQTPTSRTNPCRHPAARSSAPCPWCCGADRPRRARAWAA